MKHDELNANATKWHRRQEGEQITSDRRKRVQEEHLACTATTTTAASNEGRTRAVRIE